MVNEVVLQKLRSSDPRDQDEAFNWLIQDRRQSFRAFTNETGGVLADGDDLLQEALLILYRQVERADFQFTCPSGLYLFAIGRNIWFKKLRKGRSSIVTYESDPVPDTVADEAVNYLERSERDFKVADLVEKLGDECSKIIWLFYEGKKSLRLISNELELSSEQVVKNKKARCMKKLKEMIEEDPQIKSLLQ